MSESCEIVVRRHIEAVKAGDVDAIMADYADDAVILQRDVAVRGRAAITELFRGMPRAMIDELVQDAVATDGEYQMIIWHLSSGLRGSDLFHVRDGRIIFQSVAIHHDG